MATFNETASGIVNEGKAIIVDLRDLFSASLRSASTRSFAPLSQWFREGPIGDPVHVRKILVRLLKILIFIELIGAFWLGISSDDWGRFGADLFIAGILYLTWGRITTTLREKKEEYRKKIEVSPEHISLWDALIFSLLWSDEIYSEIPADRRRLVVISYTLIALGLLAAFLQIGTGLMVLVVSGALVLGAVNLATWVISLERGEKETLRAELKLAREVQIALLPKEHPALPGFDIAGLSIPAREVGGDHFDYSRPGGSDGMLGISVVDVSGKGLQAAMSAVFTNGAFASEAKLSASPAEILTRLNTSVYTHSRRGHFVAFLLAVINPSTKVMTFANAGQTKPLLRSGGTVKWLDAVGVHFPLGMQPDSSYTEQTVQLSKGDMLFLLTDGYTEAMNVANETFGVERIEVALSRPGIDKLGAEKLLDYVTGNIRLFTGNAPQHDDMTMVVVKVL